jgi:hypothetical protein
VIEANLSAASIGTSDLLPFIEQQIRDAHADPANLVFDHGDRAGCRTSPPERPHR